ncbi:MAG: FAD:protein FMN transferase [Treponema sp.]|nr:FAD:protein FMN transferase [Treponema sp.]
MSESFFAMDTFMTVKISSVESESVGKIGKLDKKRAEKILAEVKNEIFRLEKMLSVTKKESDVYKINSVFENPNDKKMVPVHGEVKEIFDFSLAMYEETNGFFNPALYPVVREWGFTTGDYKIPSDEKISALISSTDFSQFEILPSPSDSEFPFSVNVPEKMMVDFGAVAKGFSGDKVISQMKNAGVSSALIDFGGNVQSLGRKSDGSLWNVGIRSPWGDEVACAVKVESAAVITSGGYERFFVGDDGKTYIHIFDFRSGKPIENEIASVSVIAKNGAYADSLCTALFVMGVEGAIEFWRERRDFDFVIMTNGKTDDENSGERNLIYSEGIADSVEIVIPFEKVRVVHLKK